MQDYPAGKPDFPASGFPEEEAVRHKVIVNLYLFSVCPSELVTQEPDKFTLEMPFRYQGQGLLILFPALPAYGGKYRICVGIFVNG